jgi:hypothetical protein
MLTQVELLLINLKFDMCKIVKASDVKVTTAWWRR